MKWTLVSDSQQPLPLLQEEILHHQLTGPSGSDESATLRISFNLFFLVFLFKWTFTEMIIGINMLFKTVCQIKDYLLFVKQQLDPGCDWFTSLLSGVSKFLFVLRLSPAAALSAKVQSPARPLVDHMYEMLHHSWYQIKLTNSLSL